MAKLSGYEMKKYEWRSQVFLKKLNEGTKFKVSDGREIVFENSPDFEKVLVDGTASEMNALRFKNLNSPEEEFKLTDLIKTSEFGGRAEGFGVRIENQTIESIKKQLEDIKVKESTATVPILIGKDFYNIFTVVSTPGTPKSDFHFLDINGKEIAWCSHKDGTTAKDFQQWSGLSQSKELRISQRDECKKFVGNIKLNYPKGLSNGMTVAMKIHDKGLKMMAMYGNEWGVNSPFGRNNVTFIAQGKVQLRKVGNHYEFTANKFFKNSEEMVDQSYAPTLMAIYKGDRSDYGIRGTRLVISPFGGRKITYIIS